MTQILWRPSPARIEQSALHRFTQLAQERSGRALASYSDLHTWSVQEPLAFWRLALEFFELQVEGDLEPVRQGDALPEARYFPKVRLNFAENLLRPALSTPDAVALVSVSETRQTERVTYAQLRQRALAFAARLKALGVEPGDRVVGFVPNITESVVAMLGASAIGAIWSSCSPDFGAQGVLDRFGQIGPKVLVAANGYAYGGKSFDCLARLQQIAERIEELQHIVVIPYRDEHPVHLDGVRPRLWSWGEFLSESAEIPGFPRLPFNHPLYIMYSSGTTGVPKCIVHGAGGTLLQHAKELILHTGLSARSNICYFTTCGWMMWNWLVSSLFVGATVTLFDGSPTHPGLDRLWRLVQEEKLTHLGTSPKFLGACRGALHPGRDFDLSSLEVLLSTGAPLLPEDFDWVYGEVKQDLQLASISGGTDIISCFMLGVPTLPVVRGEIQALGLGMDVAAYNQAGEPVVGQKGELVCRTPFPSAPVSFWNDPSGERYLSAYFPHGPGTWYHGDYIELTGSQGSAGGVVVYGRSDATLNPGGVRIGTAEIYRLVETMPQVADSIVVGREVDGDVRVVLFVKMAEGHALTEAFVQRLRSTIRAGATPRHVPAEVHEVQAIPYTISGKKVELAVRRILAGEEPKNRSALANPEALDEYARFAG